MDPVIVKFANGCSCRAGRAASSVNGAMNAAIDRSQMQERELAVDQQSSSRSRRPKLPTDVYLPTRLSPADHLARAKMSRANTKQALVLSMLRRSNGATLTAIMKATGWRRHSVRGFMAGVVKRKLKLPLASEIRANGERAYRIKRARLK